MRVAGSRIRKETAADSKISGYVWTGPKKLKVIEKMMHTHTTSISNNNTKQAIFLRPKI